MSRLSAVYEALDSAVKLLEPLLPITNSCMVDFITDDLWTQLVPPQLGEELLHLPGDQLLQLPAADPTLYRPGAVRQLCRQLYSHRLVNTGVLSPIPPRAPAPPYLDRFLQEKKQHETALLSSVVAGLALRRGISHLVDVGSGKGYLSSVLALTYGLSVLALEGNRTHSSGAVKLGNNLQRSWDAIMSRSEALQSGELPVKRSKKWKQRNKERDRVLPPDGARLNYVLCHVTPDTDVCALIGGDGPVANQSDVGSVGLVGLHTCGDLAVTSMKLFLKQPISLLVNVGCCYHLQEEQFEGECWADVAAGDFSFPLSRPLLQRRFRLGQNSRGAAAQAAEKSAAIQREPSPSLYYRALLQLFVRDKLGVVPTDINVGRIARRTSGYLQYMYRALQKYPVQHQDIGDDELLQYYERHLLHKRHLDAFYVLRASLAPLVESVVLLDRLAFLLEQDSVEDAALVQLFDPVTSPRCYALIGWKR